MKLSAYSKTATTIINWKLILPVLLFLPFAGFSQSPGFTILGNVEGLQEGAEVKIITTQNEPQLIASGKAVKGKFMLKGNVEEPGLFFLVMDNAQPHYVFLDNSKIGVEGKKQDLKNLKIKGSSSHDDFLDFKKVFDPLVGEMSAFGAQINKETNTVVRDSLKIKYDSIVYLVQSSIDAFVKEKPNSYVSPFLLVITLQMNDDVTLLENRFAKLTPAMQQSRIGASLQQHIAASKTGQVGSLAMDFTQPDVNGKPVSLSSFRGKYVLVDFWASWCRPCRIENPNVVENYNKFKGRNFTVLGVSLDRPGQKESWLKAIEQDKLTWTNVSDLKFWQNEAAVLYRVSGIPFNILVDPEGRVIARNLRGPDLEAKLCEVLGCN
jgi:thiol-disulfide isomerase/thioredoxin